MEVLNNYEAVGGFVERVQSYADLNKKSFGFLPAPAYEELALKDQLWVIATECNSDVMGYLLFGGVFPTLRVTQLFTNGNHRKSGVGKKLIDTLIEFAQEKGYLSISARVASDLPANRFWEKMGFKISKQVQGGKTTSRIINLRSYQFTANSLLIEDNEEQSEVLSIEKPILSTPVYALDLNPLFDLAQDREGSSEARIIFKKGFFSSCQICVTPEFENELARHSHRFKDDPILKIASLIPKCEAGSLEKIEQLREELRSIVFPNRALNGKKSGNDNSDLIHLAHCIASNVDGFVTREKAILKNSQLIFEKYKLKIIAPEEITFEESSEQSINFSSDCGDVVISMVPLVEGAKTIVHEKLIGLGVKKELASDLVLAPISQSNLVKLVIKANDNIIGFTSWNKPDKLNRIVDLHFYIDENVPNVTQAIDHILERTSKDTKLNETARIDISLLEHQDIAKDTALKRGFLRSKSGELFKIVYHGFLDEHNWTKFKTDFEELSGYLIQEGLPNKATLENTGILIQHPASLYKKSLNLFDFETLVSPSFLLYQGRECLLIPIREEYANQLLGNVRNQPSLFPSNQESLLIERAYFKACGREHHFQKGRLVLFYVSGKNSIQEIIGLARITSSSTISSEAAKIQFIRQGVLSSREIDSLAKEKNLLHAFTFDNFMHFPNPMPFKKAREANVISPANLVTAEKLDHDKFKEVIDFAYKK